MNSYTIEVFYSEEDEGYIAVVPELPGCSAFGETQKEALKEIGVAIELRLKATETEEEMAERSDFSQDKNEEFSYTCSDVALENPDKTEIAVVTCPR